MDQRQPRLGDILDDYCPRERRVTNHAVVAMVGSDVKQTRCTTCESEHEYKHAQVPRQRRKSEPAALYGQAVAGAPKRAAVPAAERTEPAADTPVRALPEEAAVLDEPVVAAPALRPETLEPADEDEGEREHGPVHRRLIRASLPKLEGQPPATRPMPEFTIRQPTGGRPNRFRQRQPPQARGAQGFQGQRGNVGGGQPPRGGRPGGQGQGHGGPRRHGSGNGHKRSK